MSFDIRSASPSEKRGNAMAAALAHELAPVSVH